MDQFEKLLQQETDTNEKYSAAADFFMGLKVAKVMPTHAKKRKPSVKSKALADSKLLTTSSGVKAVKLPVPAAKVVATPAALPGQAKAVQTKATKYKKLPPIPKAVTLPKGVKKVPKPKKVKTASIEDKKALLIEALLMEKQAFMPFTGLSRGVRQAIRGGGKITERAGAAAAGAKQAFQPDVSRFGLIADAIKRKAAKSTPTFSRWGKSIGEKYKGVKTKAQNFMDPNLARARKQAATHVDDYLKAAGPKPTTPGPALVEWEKGYAQAAKKQSDYMSGYEKARKVSDVTGAKSTGGEIWNAIKGEGGKISPSSVYKGLEGLGLASPEAVIGGAVGVGGALKAAKSAREAAKAKKQMMMFGGGAAGLTGLSLLKGRKQESQAMPVRMV